MPTKREKILDRWRRMNMLSSAEVLKLANDACAYIAGDVLGVASVLKPVEEGGLSNWKDANEIKPPVKIAVLLFRSYGPDLELKKQTGFSSYGYWDGRHWHDWRFEGLCNDVKYWHELPPVPAGESEGD